MHGLHIPQEDAHIPHLLALPPGTDLHAHPLVRGGALVLQDKASCFSAEALLGDVRHAETEGAVVVGDVIDACAAPGAFVVLPYVHVGFWRPCGRADADG